MLRVLFISFFVLFLSAGAYPQLSSVGGAVSYTHRYSDNLADGRLSTFLGRSPALNLRGFGSLISDRVAIFSLETYFSRNDLTSRSLGLRSDFSSSYFTIYNFNVTAFQYSPLQIRMRARDGLVRSENTTGSETGGVSAVRSREQQLGFTLRKIPILPVLTFNYGRSNSKSVEGVPVHNGTEVFTASTASSNGTTSINFSGQTNISTDHLTGTRIRYSAVNLNASKTLTGSDRISLQSDYTWFTDLGRLQNTLSYTGLISPKVRIGSNVGVSHSASSRLSHTNLQGTVNVIITQDQHWRYGINSRALRQMQSVMTGPSTVRHNRTQYSTGGSVTHTGRLLAGDMSNTLFLGGSWDFNDVNVVSYRAGLSNTYGRTIGRTRFRLTHSSLTSSFLREGGRQWRFEHMVNLDADSKISSRISNRGSVRFTDRENTETTYEKPLSTSTVLLNESMHGRFNYVIPFSVAAGFSINWYFGEVSGRTYGWDATFNSPRFFVNQLSVRYDYRRRYNVAVRRESIDQVLRFTYRWRMLDFRLYLHQRDLLSRQRDVTFTVERPF